jgi:NAD(P)-dependent dehydrogenase (short-subunit alcohol dehydrogenase family)
VSAAAEAPLAGRVALITGASSGIGAATAQLFARAGAKVALLARRETALAEVASAIESETLILAADVCDPAAVREAVAATVRELGGLHMLVNSAGVVLPAPLAQADDAHWRTQIDVNLSGSFYAARAAGLHMAASDGGAIVNVGSELSRIGMASYVAYCASKAGVIGLTKALAADLAPKVTVNAICPGPVDTPMLAAELECFGEPEQMAAETRARVPLGRLASAEEVARGIFYLAVEAPYATGATLQLDGGTTAV